MSIVVKERKQSQRQLLSVKHIYHQLKKNKHIWSTNRTALCFGFLLLCPSRVRLFHDKVKGSSQEAKKEPYTTMM